MEYFHIYVEKKQGFNVEAVGVMSELKTFLHMNQIQEVRVFNRYDVTGMSKEAYEKALYTVFAEPQADLVYEGDLPEVNGFCFMQTYLKGQYDQRADSCCQCIRTIDSALEPVVKTSKVYVIQGKLTKEDEMKIKEYIINPIESEEVEVTTKNLLDMNYPVPEDIKVIEGFIAWEKEALEEYRKQEGLAMSLDDLVYFQHYFKEKEKNPTHTELKVVDTYWSDHCRHTTFMTELTDIQVEEGAQSLPIQQALESYYALREALYGERDKKVSLMDLATISVKSLKQEGYLTKLVESQEINACTIQDTIMVDKNEEDYLILFKNETHNHPTEIEPFGGAATCLGGAIRDPLSGRAYVYQAMRVTGAADVTEPIEETLKGKLPQRKITQTAANGYSAYGNQIGLATGEVKEYYHPGYKAKRLEVGAVVGAVPANQVRREEPEAGDIVLLIGGATGRDGCGGATGSSKEHHEESLMQCGSEVQKGNPVEERKIQRIFRNETFSKAIKRCNDFGAGGVCVAIGEIADGLIINLDAVPVKYKGLNGTELAISESQERMAIAVEACDEALIKELCAQENLEAVKVAEVTQAKRLVMVWRGKEIVNIERKFLDSAGVTAKREVKIEAPRLMQEVIALTKENVCKVLSSLNVASQKGLGMQFDGSIGAGSVLMPYGGAYQRTKEVGMVAKIPVLKGQTHAATYMTHGFDPVVSEMSPFHGSVYAVLESIAKLVALGADYKEAYLSFQEYFERLGEDPCKWGKPAASLLGAMVVQQALKVGAIGGKDSMSGTFENLHVPPTLISFTCAMGDARTCVSGSFKNTESKIVYVRIPKDQYGIPNLEIAKASYDRVYELACAGKTRAAYTVGKGGIVAALAQMCVGNNIGAQVELERYNLDPFVANYGDLILEVSTEIAQNLNPNYFMTIGSTTVAANLQVNEVVCELEEVNKQLDQTFAQVFVQKVPEEGVAKDVTFNTAPRIYQAKEKFAQPKVVIPVFPGTNCEYDTRRAFERAGAQVEEVLFINRSASDIEESIKRIAKSIESAQIIAFPGGFSAGDEPDGSAKFIAAAFRNEQLKEAVHKHLYEQDGLMLGICNGFQVLVKLGLLPYGEIRTMDELSPTLTYNTIGKHISLMTTTKITSVASPWLAQVELGAQHKIALSHGEGRFVAPQQVLDQLVAQGQIFSQYVNEQGIALKDGSVNPNGSYLNIEGLVSADGRIIGKMGHSERIGQNIHMNIPGAKDQKLFESGVNYFRG